MNQITGNFANNTAGLAKLSWGGTDVGFLKENLSLRFDKESLDFEVDTPSQFVGRIVTRFLCTISAKMAEVAGLNFALASGIGASGVVAISAGATAIAGGSKLLTSVASGINGWRAPFHGTVSSLVVKSPDQTTTYVLNTDYTLVAGSASDFGGFNIVTGSSLATAFGTDPHAWVSYSIDVGALDRIVPGETFAFETQSLLVMHRRPNTGKFIRAYIPKAMAMGKAGLEFSEGKWQLNDFAATAIPDPTCVDHRGYACPYGWVDFQK